MTAIAQFRPARNAQAFALAALAIWAFALAAEAHAFCSIYCIHGDRMVATDICTSRS